MLCVISAFSKLFFFCYRLFARFYVEGGSEIILKRFLFFFSWILDDNERFDGFDGDFVLLNSISRLVGGILERFRYYESSKPLRKLNFLNIAQATYQTEPNSPTQKILSFKTISFKKSHITNTWQHKRISKIYVETPGLFNIFSFHLWSVLWLWHWVWRGVGDKSFFF